MKRFFLVSLLVVIVVSGLILSGCGGAPAPSTPAPAKPAAPAPAPAPTQVIELKYHHTDPVVSDTHVYAHQRWADNVERVTRGRVKVTIYHSSALTTSAEFYNATKSGIVDIGWGFTGMLPGQFPLLDVGTLPKLGFTSGRMASEGIWNLYDKFPEIKAELADVKVLLLHGSDPRPLSTSKKPVRTVDDAKGLKIRTLAGGEALMIKALGATSVLTAPGDIFTNMEKGVIDGHTMDYSGITSFKLTEVSNYFTDAQLDVIVFMVVMNQAKWNSIPPDLQQAIMSVSGLEGARLFGTAWDRNGYKGLVEIMRTPGKQLIVLSPDEVAKFTKLAEPVRNDYVAGLEAKGKPAKKVLDEVNRFVKEYKP